MSEDIFKKVMNDKITLGLGGIGLLFLLLSVFNMFKISLGNNFLTQAINLFSPTIWLILGLVVLCSAVLAYFKKYNLMIILLLIALLGITAMIRTSNIEELKDVTTGDWALGPDLDPFLYLRHAHEIADGTLENPDMMRAAPLGAPNYAYTNLMPWAIIFVHKLISVFKSESITYAAIIAPVIFFCISIIGFFLFIYFLSLFRFSKKISMLNALFASVLYSIIPSMVARTVAGDPEIESLGMVFFWFAFLFYILAWRKDELNYKIGFAALAGIFTGLMSYTWGGYRYIYMGIVLTTFILFLFQKDEKNNLIIYSSWIIPSLILEFSKSRSITSILTNLNDTGFASVVFLFLIVNFFISKKGIREKFDKLNLPTNILSVLLTGLGALVALFLVNRTLLYSLMSRLIEGFLYPWGRSRIGLTVAENKAPYFIEALGSFGNLMWLFLIGTIFLFYQAVKHFKKEKESDFEKWVFILIVACGFSLLFYSGRALLSGTYSQTADQIDFLILVPIFFSLVGSIYFFFRKNINLSLNFSFLFFILALIFSRISVESRLLNGESLFAKGLYFSGLLVFGGILLLTLISVHRSKDRELLEKFKEINMMYILLLVLSFWAIVSIRGAIRLFFIISPILVIISAFIFLDIYEQRKRMNKKLFWGAIIISILIFAQIFTVYTLQTQNTAKSMIPSAYHQQWQSAMSWVRENTPQESIFIHWWDYGYWVQTLGERATVVDGGHQWGYWDHLVGRYILTAQSPEMALSMMKSYNVSYLLIDSTDIGKYAAFSKIGSDTQGEDRYGYIPTLLVDNKQTMETSNKTIRVYTGGGMVDEDILYTPEGENSKEIFIPKENSYVIFVILEVSLEGNESVIEQPKAVYYHNGQQTQIPIRYLHYAGNLFDYETGLEATISILPKITQTVNNQLQQDSSGAAMYISPKITRTAFAQLYLLNNYEGRYSQFELVHSEQDFYINYLKTMGHNINELAYIAGGLRGPIKIWKVSPGEEIEVYEDWLKTSGDYAEFDDYVFVK